MVDGAHRLAILGSAFLGLAMVSVVLLIFDLVAGATAGAVAAVLAAVMLIGLWLVMPLSMRRYPSAPPTRSLPGSGDRCCAALGRWSPTSSKRC